MNKLTWWFRIVGAVYIVLGASWLPALNAPKIDLVIPGFDGPAGGTAYSGYLDWMLMFALEMMVVGAFLIYASFSTGRHIPVVTLIIALSVVRGIAHDLYMITAGYSVVTNLAFVALHTAVIVTGLLALRSAKRVGSLASSD